MSKNVEVYKDRTSTGNDVYIVLHGVTWLVCLDDLPLREPDLVFQLPETAGRMGSDTPTYKVAAKRYAYRELRARSVRQVFSERPQIFEVWLQVELGSQRVAVDEHGDVAVYPHRGRAPVWLDDLQLIQAAAAIEGRLVTALSDITQLPVRRDAGG